MINIINIVFKTTGQRNEMEIKMKYKIKKGIILLLTICLTTNILGMENSHAETMKNYDMDQYQEDVYYLYKAVYHDSFENFLNDNSKIDYCVFISQFEDIENYINAGAFILDVDLTQEKYFEILTNLLGIMDCSLQEFIEKQSQIDTLKSFADYAVDLGDIVGSALSLDSEALKSLNQSLSNGLSGLIKAMDTGITIEDFVLDSLDRIYLYERVGQEYEYYHLFLQAIIDNSENLNLKNAAETLLHSTTKMLQFQLNIITNATGELGHMLGKDILLDTVLPEMIKNKDTLNLTESDCVFYNSLYKIYEKATNLGTVAFKSTIFIGDMLAGTTNMYIRYNDILAMSEIREALTAEIESINKDITYSSQFNEMQMVAQLMKNLVYVDFRGYYSLYNIVQNDARIARVIYFDSYETNEKWYEAAQALSDNLIGNIDSIFPEIENYLIEDNTEEKQNISAAGNGTEIQDEYIDLAVGESFSFGTSLYQLCYKDHITWDEAQAYCMGEGGNLATITSQEEQNAVFSYINGFSLNKDIWIGMTDIDEEGNWSTWVTGENVEYTNWGWGEPDNGGEQDYCVICPVERKGNGYNIAPGQWDDLSVDSDTLSGYFLLEIDSNVTALIENSYQNDMQEIPRGTVTFNGHLYYCFEKGLSWKEAEEACKAMGGHLATITSEDESNFLSKLVQSGEKYAYWLGGTDEKEEGVWEWVTGEAWVYENWISGQPDNHSDINKNPEDYLTMERNKKGWNDVQNTGDPTGNNSLEHTGYICEWDDLSIVP